METIRRRAPFKFSESEKEEDSTQVLDEQEQDEIIHKLRKDNDSYNQIYILCARIIIAGSAFIHFMFLLRSSKESPLLFVFAPSTPGPYPTIPLPSLFTLLSLFLHLNLVLLFHADDIRTYLQLTQNPEPLSYKMLYALAAVAPTLSLFLNRTWQTTAWWCVTGGVVCIVQTIMDAIDTGNESISDLETMKYTAPGA